MPDLAVQDLCFSSESNIYRVLVQAGNTAAEVEPGWHWEKLGATTEDDSAQSDLVLRHLITAENGPECVAEFVPSSGSLEPPTCR